MSFLFLILAATFSGIGANPIANELNNNSELESSAVNSVLWSKTPKIASSVDSPISPVLKCDSDNSLYGNVDDSVQKRSGMCPWTGRTGSAEQSNAPAETPKKARVTSESPCAGSPLLNYLSCGGGRLRISLYYGGGISYVLNCVPGKLSTKFSAFSPKSEVIQSGGNNHTGERIVRRDDRYSRVLLWNIWWHGRFSTPPPQNPWIYT